MDFQLFLVGICVIWAGTYVARRTIAFWRHEQSGCGSSCTGCPSSAHGPTVVELTIDDTSAKPH